MTQMLADNWPIALIGLLIAFLLIWWVVLATRRTRVTTDRRDTLDEGAERAARNQALIDAPPAVLRTDIPVHAPEPVAEPIVAGDDLTRIKGLGPKLAALLGTLGVTRFDQIAAWSDADIDRIDAQLGRFAGRIRRDDWVGQASLLASGDIAAFRTRFGAN